MSSKGPFRRHKKYNPEFVPELVPEYKSEFRPNSGTNSGMYSGKYFPYVVYMALTFYNKIVLFSVTNLSIIHLLSTLRSQPFTFKCYYSYAN